MNMTVMISVSFTLCIKQDFPLTLSENQRKQRYRQLLGPWQRTKKTVKREVDGDRIVIDSLRTVSKGLEMVLEC